MNRNEKGQISPAQSKVAQRMRGGSTPLSERTMGRMAENHEYGGEKHGRFAYGQMHHGTGGMARMARLKEVNKGKRAKSRVILRGQESAGRKQYTKVGARMHKKGLLHAPKE